MDFSAIHPIIASFRNRQSVPIRKLGILPCLASLPMRRLSVLLLVPLPWRVALCLSISSVTFVRGSWASALVRWILRNVQCERGCCAYHSAERRGSQLREAVRAPLFRANSIMDKEQAVRVILPFDCSEAGIIAAPVRVLPTILEEIALTEIRSRIRHERAKLSHALMNAARSFAACHNRWLMPENSRICGPLAIARDRQSEGGQHGWIHCGFPRLGDRVWWRSG